MSTEMFPDKSEVERQRRAKSNPRVVFARLRPQVRDEIMSWKDPEVKSSGRILTRNKVAAQMLVVALRDCGFAADFYTDHASGSHCVQFALHECDLGSRQPGTRFSLTDDEELIIREAMAEGSGR